MTFTPTIEIPDRNGLICGFTLNVTEKAKPLALYAASERETIPSSAHWLHFNLADTRATNWIHGCAHIPDDARELLLDSDAHIRSENFDAGSALIIGDLFHHFKEDPEEIGVLRLYLDTNLLITGRGHPLKSVDRLRHELFEGLVISNSIDLFARLIYDIGDSIHSVIKQLNDRVDDAEDQILAGQLQNQGSKLGQMRRLLARLRRLLSANRQALQHALPHISRWSKHDISELRQAVEHLESTVQDLELVQERTRLLQEEIAGRMSEATNRNLYVLSIVTVTLLPINLITGIFGMNTGGLPWGQDDPSGFWWVIFFMIIAVIVSLSILQKKRIL
ncbi:MAG: Mg2+/Co2+ transporter [Gammaproteobacteria bacterium]|nr:MAG: Mg2+/Co2+ transporter [Gammaproteobacteria bacterium]